MTKVKTSTVITYKKEPEKGERGAFPRGPAVFDNTPGTEYCEGAAGELFYDIRWSSGLLFRCKRSYTVTSSSPAPQNDSTHWEVFSIQDLVMTKTAFFGDSSGGWVIDNGVIQYVDANGTVKITLSRAGTINAGSGKFVVTKDGEVTSKLGTFTNIDVQSGKIAGFKISGNGLTNDPFTNDAYIIFRNDGQKAFAGIGGNVLPASSGARAVARFENHDDTDTWGLGTNYGMLVSARGLRNNRAIHIDGGDIAGFAMHNTILSSGKTLSRYDYNVLCINTSEINIYLPTMQLYDDGHVIRFKRMGGASVKIWVSACYTWNGTSYRYTNPVIVYNRNGTKKPTEYLELDSDGDSFELVWVRDVNRLYDGTQYYGMWVQYKLPRDW